jgi:hypothetical protein
MTLADPDVVDGWRAIWQHAPAAATKLVVAQAVERGQDVECLTALLVETRTVIDGNKVP